MKYYNLQEILWLDGVKARAMKDTLLKIHLTSTNIVSPAILHAEPATKPIILVNVHHVGSMPLDLKSYKKS